MNTHHLMVGKRMTHNADRRTWALFSSSMCAARCQKRQTTSFLECIAYAGAVNFV